jgi:hypothetical protein
MSWYKLWVRGRRGGKTAEAEKIAVALRKHKALTEVSERLPINGEELADGDDPVGSEIKTGFFTGTVPLDDACQHQIPYTYQEKIRVDSIWKRNPPKKEVVRVGRVWWVPVSKIPPSSGARQVDGGWTVRAHPVRGGKVLVADAQWFLDNFTEQS